MVTAKDPLRLALNKVYPAAVYARPAVAPLVVGVGGTVGKAQANLNEMYKYTLQQMAVSPFAVNSEEYMNRIRNEYGYSDSGMYEAMGTVGSVVGAGVGAFLGGNFIKSGFLQSPWEVNYGLLNKASWSKDNWRSPFKKMELQNPFKTGGSKRQQTSAAFHADYTLADFTKNNSVLVSNYNKSLKGYNTAKAKLERFTDKHGTDISKYTDEIKKEYQKLNDALNTFETDTTTYANKIQQAANKIRNDEIKELTEKYTKELADKATKEVTEEIAEKASKEVADRISKEAAEEAMTKGAVKSAAEAAGKAANKAAIKIAGAVSSAAGITMDAVSFGTNVAGSVQAFQDADIFNGIMYLVGGLGDIVSIVGDAVTIAAGWTGVGFAAGEALNWIGTIVSIAAGALTGIKVGETVGHSLSPEGAKAQELFAKNLYGSITDRLLTTVATLVTTALTPVALDALAKSKIPVVSPISNFLANNAWGNYLRSSVTMMATQGINSLTTKIEDTWNPPEEASDVNFVTAFSVIGDLNDNLYGATARKATLLGLVKGDPKAQTEALARAWGYSNEDIYYNPTFDDIRQAANIDLGNLGNSIVGVIGEVLIDPQNLSEIAKSISDNKLVDAGVNKFQREINITKAQMYTDVTKVNKDVADILFKKVSDGKEEYYIKTVYYDHETKVYSDTGDTKNSLEVYKDKNGIYHKVNNPNETIDAVHVSKAYDGAMYSNTTLGGADYMTLRKILKSYIQAYINGGISAVRSVHIDMVAPTLKGSSYKIADTIEDLFVEKFVSAVENTLTKNNSEYAILQKEIEDAIKNTPKKFQQLYTYYNEKGQDGANLILKLQTDFDNLKITDAQLHKMYQLHSGFANQMDIIDSVNKVINTLANPLGVLVTAENLKKGWDLVSKLRYNNTIDNQAKISIEVDDALNKKDPHNITQEDIDNTVTNLKNRTKDIKIDTLTDKAAASDEIEEIVKDAKRFTDTINKVKEDKQKLAEYHKAQSFRVYDDKATTMYVEITDMEVAKKEILELQNKKTKTTEERKRLRMLEEAYIRAFNAKWFNGTRIELNAKIDSLFSILDPLTQEATKYATELILMYHKFSKLVTTDLTTEQYQKELSKLEQFFALTGGRINRVPADPKNTMIDLDIDLAEYICSVLNRYLLDEFGEDVYKNIKFTEVLEIRKILESNKIRTFSDWNKHKGKATVLNNIIRALSNPEDSTVYRVRLYMEKIVNDKVLGTINKVAKNTKGTHATHSVFLVDVDIDLLKRKIISELLKVTYENGKAVYAHPEFAQALELVIKQLRNIQALLDNQTELMKRLEENGKISESNSLKKDYKEKEGQVKFLLEILKSSANSYITRAIATHPIFNILKEYIYTDIAKGTSFIPSIFDTELYAELDKETRTKLAKGEITDDNQLAEINEKLSRAKIVPALAYAYRDKHVEESELPETETDITYTHDTDINDDPDDDLLADTPVINSGVKQTNIVTDVTKDARDDYHLNNLEDDTTYTTNFKFKSDTAYSVCRLCSGKVESKDEYKEIIDYENGYVEVQLKPSTFVDESGKVWIYSQLFEDEIIDNKRIKGVTRSKHYRTKVVEFVDELIKLVQDGVITIVGDNGKIYNKTNIKNIRRSLINKYMNATKNTKGITVRYNYINTYGQSSTGNYYRKLLQRELYKSIALNIKQHTDGTNNYIEYDNKKILIPNTYKTPKEVFTYFMSVITDKTHKDYNICKSFIESIYERANTYINKNLGHDKKLGINKDIIALSNDIHTFEIKSIQSRRNTVPVVSTDLVKKHVCNSQDLKDVFNDLKLLAEGNIKDQTTIVGKMLVAMRNYVEETPSMKYLDISQFKGVIKKDDEYYFITNQNKQISFTSMLLTYSISKAQLDKLLNRVLQNSTDTFDRTHYYTEINAIHTNVSNLLYDRPTKQEFVEYVQANTKHTKEEIEEMYDTLYSDPESYQLLMMLTYNTRDTKDIDIEIKYNKKIIELYMDAMKNNKGASETERNKLFLKIVLTWNPTEDSEIKLKRFLLEHVFFKDFKQSKGIFNKAHIENLKKAKRIVEDKAKQNPENTYLDYIIKDLDSRIKYCENGQELFKDQINKNVWIDKLMNLTDATEIEDALKVFDNTTNYSDTSNYSIVKTTDGEYVIAYANSADYFEDKGKGAGKHNIWIMHQFKDLLKGKKLSTDTVYENGDSILYINTDPDLNINEFKKQQNKKHVYVLTLDQYNDLRDMAKGKTEFETITVKDQSSPKSETPWELHTVDTRINVQSSKVVVSSYIEDLENIMKVYGNDLDIFYKFVRTYNEVPMLQKSYIARPSLLSSRLIKRMGEDAEVSVIFLEIISKLKNKINMDVLKDFINDDTIKNNKDLNKASKIWIELQKIEIENGKTADVLIEEEVERLRNLHKTTPIKPSLDYNKVLSSTLMNNLLNLKNIIYRIVKLEEQGVVDNKLTRSVWNEVHTKSMDEIAKRQIRDAQRYNSDILNKEITDKQGNTIKVLVLNKDGTVNTLSTLNNIKEYYKGHRNELDEEYIARSARNYNERNILTKKKIHFKTMHEIIRRLLDYPNKIYKKENGKVVFDSPLLQILLENNNTLQVIEHLESLNKTEEEINKILYNDIIYPFIQNISLDFYKKPMSVIEEAEYILYGMYIDPKYVAASIYNHILKADNTVSDKTLLTYEQLKNAVNEDIKQYIPESVPNSLNKLISDCEQLTANRPGLIEECNNKILKAFVEYIAHTKGYKKDHNPDIFEDYSKQRTKIEESDYNKYTYKEDTGLQRTDYIVFKEGTKREDQKNVITIAKSVANDTGDTELETIVNDMLHTLANGLSSVHNYEKPKNDEMSKVESFLDTHNIKTTNGLRAYIIDKAINELKNKYDIHENNEKDFRNMVNTAITLYRLLCSTRPGDTDKFARVINVEKELQKYETDLKINEGTWDDLQKIIAEYQEHHVYLLKTESDTNIDYKSSGHFVRAVDSELFLNSRKFYNYLKRHLKLKGVLANDYSTEFSNAQTLLEFYRSIYRYINDTNKPEFYSLLVLVNHMKDQYVGNVQGDAKWDKAYNQQQAEYAKYVTIFNDIDNIYGRGIDNETNIYDDLNTPFQGYMDATKAIKTVNGLLGRTISTKGPSIRSANPVTVFRQEKGLAVALKQINRYTTAPLFKTDNTFNINAQLANDLNIELNTEQLELIQEMSATSLDKCFTTSGFYHELRRMFTDILQASAFTKNKNDFVRIMQITNALRTIREHPQLAMVYLQQYEMYVGTKAINEENKFKIDKAFKEITTFFDNRQQYLTKMNTETIKAIMGYIYFTTYNKQSIDVKSNTIKKALLKVYSNKDTIEYNKSQDVITKANQICKDASLSEDERTDKLFKLYYPDIKTIDDSTKKTKEWKDLNTLVKLTYISANSIQDANTFDTWQAVQSKVTEATLEEFIAKSEYVKVKRDQVEHIENEIHALKDRMNTIKNTKHKIGVVENDKIKYHEFTLEEEDIAQTIANLEQEQKRLQKKIDKQNTDINALEANVAEELQQLEILFLDTSLGNKYKENYNTYRKNYFMKYYDSSLKIIKTNIEKILKIAYDKDFIIQYCETVYNDLLNKDIDKDIYNKRDELLQEIKSKSKQETVSDLFTSIRNEIKKIIKTETNIHKYDNYETDEFLKIEYAHQVFEHFKIELYRAKKTVQKEQKEQLEKFLQGFKDTLTLSTVLYNKTKESYETRLKNKKAHFNNTYELLKKKLPWITFEDTTNDQVIEILKDIKVQYETELSDTSTIYIELKNKVLKDPNYTKKTLSLDKNELAKVLKDFEILPGESSKETQERLFKYIQKNNKNIEDYIKDKNSLNADVLRCLCLEAYINTYAGARITLTDFLNKLIDIQKDIVSLETKKSAIDKIKVSDEEYKHIILNNIEEHIGDIDKLLDLEFAEDATTYKYVFSPANNKQLKSMIMTRTNYESTKNANNSVLEQLKEYNTSKGKLETETKDLVDAQKRLVKTETQVKNAYEHREKETSNTSNSNMYKKYTKEISKEYNNGINVDENLIEHVRKRAVNDGLISKEDLNKAINKAGDGTLHNSVIDCLITVYNYLYINNFIDSKGVINKTLLKDFLTENRFIVMDMETVTDITNEPTPYQITAIDVHFNNGKFETTITTAHYNSFVFIGAEDALKNLKNLSTEPGKEFDDLSSLDIYLQNFVRQQQRMYLKDEPNITQQEVIDRILNIIDKATGRTNTLETTEALITLLNNRTCPIVAHNGERFDFVHYDNFMQTYARKLIQNEFFRIQFKPIKDIKNSIDHVKAIDSLHISEAEKDALRKTLLEMFDSFEKGEYRTDLSLLKYEQYIKQLMNATIRSTIKYATQKAAKELNIEVTSKSLQRLYDGKNSTFEKIIDYCYEYLNAPNRIKYLNELDAGDINKEELKLLFDVVADSFTKSNEPSEVKSVLKTVEERIIKQFNLPVEIFEGYDNERRIKMLERNISEIHDLVNNIETLNINGKFEEYEKVVDNIDKQIEALDNIIESYDDKIKELDDKIKKAENNVTKFNKELYDIMKILRDNTTNTVQRAKTILHRSLTDALNQYNIVNLNNKSIEYTIHKAEAEMEDVISVINALMKALDTGDFTDVKLQDIILDSKFQLIKNESTKKKIIKDLQTRQTEIENILKSIEEGNGEEIWRTAWDSVQETARNNVVILQKSIIKNIDILLKNTNTPEQIKKILQEYKDNISINEVETYAQTIDKLIKQIKDIKDNDIIKFIKNNNIMQTITTAVSSRSELKYNLNLIDTADVDYDQKNVAILEVFLKKENATISKTLLLAEALEIKPGHIIYDQVPQYINGIIEGLKLTDMETKALQVEVIEKAALRSPYSSKITATDPDEITRQQEEFEKHASDILPKDHKAYQDYPESTRHYVNLDEGNDIWKVIISDKIWTRSEDKNMIKISVNTYYYNQLQTLCIPKDENGNIKDKSTWYFVYKYSYDIKGSHKNKFKTKVSDPIKYTDVTSIYYKDGKTKSIAPYKYEQMEFEDGIDYNKFAIEKLHKLAKELASSKDKRSLIDKETVDIRNFDADHFIKINMSDIVRKKLLERLELLNLAQDMAGSYVNLSELYHIVYRQVMGNLNAIKPGQFLMQLPEEYEQNIITKMNSKAADILDIDLLNVSESSMGLALHEKTLYTIKALFGANTGPVRTILSTKILHSKFTPIVMNNDAFERHDTDPNKTGVLEDYIWNLDKDYNKFEKWAIEKARKEFLESNKEYTENDLNNYVEYRVNELAEFERIRYESLIGDYEYTYDDIKYRDAFQLRVGQYDTLRKYQKDILHPMGVNTTVAFIEDSRAFEDTILIDARWARAVGIDRSNKLWLKYGFKGAVRYVEGLNDMYGANVVTKKSSVISRGSYGLYEEMFSNHLLDYLIIKDSEKVIGTQAYNIFKQSDIINQIKRYTSKEITEEKRKGHRIPLIYILDNKLVVEDNEKINYEEFFNGIINGTRDLYNTKISNKKHKYNYRDILRHKITEGTEYKYIDPVTNEIKTITHNSKNSEVLKGTLYILMDPEHQASHMQSQLAVQLKDNKNMSYVLKDAKGSVRKGGQKSFTVEQSFAQKIGFDIDKYIVGADSDEYIKKQYETTWNLLLQGPKIFESYIQYKDIDGIKIIDIDNTVDNIILEFNLSTKYKILLKEYYRALSHTEDSLYEHRISEAEKKIKNHTASLWGGDTGVGYTYNYRRHLASRNQLTSNTTLHRGEIKMAADSFYNMKDAGGNEWINTVPIYIDDINKLFKDHSSNYNEPLIQFNEDGTLKDPKQKLEAYKLLRYYGILDGYKVTNKVTRMIQGTEITAYIGSLKLDPENLKRTEAYVLAVRYPVQDINATPLVKITGIVEHSAVECNAMMYKYMGADNDGDAASFTMIKYKDASDENSPLKELDASREEFYDPGDLEELSGDFSKTNTIPDNSRVGPTVAYIGKKTSPSSKFTLDENGNPIQLKNKNGKEISASVRAQIIERTDSNNKKYYEVVSDNHYTYTELIYKDTELYKQLKKEFKKANIHNVKFEGSETNNIFWLNSHVWLNNKGQNAPKGINAKEFYSNGEMLKKYYQKYKSEIDEIKAMEYWLEYTEAGQAFIEKNLERIVEEANYTTLSRGRVSKINVGVIGGYRKGIYLGTTLSTFPNMNKDPKGLIWQVYGISKDKVQEFTVIDIFNQLFDSKMLDQIKDIHDVQKLIDNYSERKKYINSKYNTKEYETNYDLEEVSKVALEHYLELRIANKVIHPLINLFTTQNPTYDLVQKLYKDEHGDIDLLMEPMLYVKEYIENLSTPEDTIVEKPILKMIQSYYFSRFVPDFEKLVKDSKGSKESIKESYIKGLQEELFLTRAVSKQLNNLIQEPISISKHGSAIADYTEVDATIKNNGENIYNKLVRNKIFVGNSYKHSRAIAMGAEYNIIDRNKIKFESTEAVKEIRSKNTKETSDNLYISKTDTRTTLKNAINVLIKNDICGGLITDTELKSFETHYKHFLDTITEHITVNRKLDLHKLLKDIEGLTEDVKEFEELGISLYKLINGSDLILQKIREAKMYKPNVYIPEEVHNVLGVLCLQGLDKDWYIDQANRINDNRLTRFINYLTEKDNPIDEDGIAEQTYVDNKYSTEDEWKAFIEGKGIVGDTDDMQQLIPKNTQIQYKLNDQYGIENHIEVTSYDLLKQYLIELTRLNQQRDNSLKQLDVLRTSKTLGEVEQEIINKEIGYGTIRNLTERASKSYTNLNEAKAERAALEKEKAEFKILHASHVQNKNKLDGIKKQLKTTTPDDVKTHLNNYKEELQKEYKEVKKQHIKYTMLNNMQEVISVLLNQGDDDLSIKVLDKDDVELFKDNILLNTDMYQHPFHVLVHAFAKKKLPDGSLDVDWNAMYKYIRDNYAYLRITEVVKAYDDEGLARKLLDYIKVVDKNLYKNKKGEEVPWDYLTTKEKQNIFRKLKHKKVIKSISSWEDLDKLSKEALKNIGFRLGNKTYTEINKDLKNVEFVSPTLKQIHIKSANDLKRIWEEGILKNKLSIGFTYMNEIISSMEDAYKPYAMSGKGAVIARTFNAVSKAIMRLSSGFLVRNMIDTFNQLLTDMYIQKGLHYMITNPKQIIRYLQYGTHIYTMYETINEERLFTLSDIRLTYKNIEESNNKDDINKLSKTLLRYLNTYILQGDALENKSERITKNLEYAKQLLEQYNKAKEQGYINKRINKAITEFLGSMSFAEYYEFYDNKIINGTTIAGMCLDPDNNRYRKIKRIHDKHKDPLFKELLIDISALMQTNAQVDLFKQKQYSDLYDLAHTSKLNMLNNTDIKTMDAIDEELQHLRAQSTNKLKVWLSNNVKDLYQMNTEWTENIARILGFILNKDLYGNTFNKSVQISLKNWFNYGQRSPLEMQLMYDIPYISFPMRSINNWRSRLLNPRYAILMDDIIDGAYGQYADEDGQYSEYEQFMIQNGWLPITNNLGIRMGAGAFDIYNIMRDPADQIEQRRNPILRGLSKLIETGDLAQATKQLASVGLINRVAQFATLGKYNASKGTMSDRPSLGRMTSATFEYNNYEKYTPKKYGYLYNNNGRAKYYENIYRDWFTKYGRMRKPTVDPVSLVKNIQWKQVLRRMQNKYRR